MRIFTGLDVYRPEPDVLSPAEVNSVATGLACCDPSLAHQSFKEEADINEIVRRFGLTGVIPQGLKVPTYQDFEDVFDFQTAQNALVAADRAFMALPAEIRKRFGNNAGEFVDFCSDPKNLDEMRKMGLAVPAAVEEPEKITKVEVVNASPPKGAKEVPKEA